MATASLDAEVTPAERGATDLRLRGRALLLARVASIGVAAIALGLTLLALPVEFRRLATICDVGSACAEPHLTPHSLRQLQALGLSRDAFAAAFLAFETLWTAIWVAIAAVIVRRRSDHVMALLGALALLTVGLSIELTDALAVTNSIWKPAALAVKVVAAVSLYLFLCLFPQGRFVPGWTRWLALVVVAFEVPSTFFKDSPVNVDTWPPALSALGWTFLFGTVVAIQIYRYRRVSDRAEREQTRWVVFGVATSLLSFIGFVILVAIIGQDLDSLPAIIFGSAFYFLILLPLPLSMGIAILRYRL